MGLLALGACTGSAERPATAAESEPPADLLDAARERGTVLVVVELAVPYRPEAELDKAEVEAQRAAIARAQDDLLAELDGHDVEVAGRPQRLPQLALAVDEGGLRALARSRLVGGLEGNVPEPPG